MAINDFRFQRHLKLWEDQNKKISRVIFLSILVGILLLIDVLTPLTKLTSHTDKVAREVSKLKQKQEILNQEKIKLDSLNFQLEKTKKKIEARPWEQEKLLLIRKFRRMRETPEIANNAKAFNDTANKTIQRIASKVQKEILSPLRNTAMQLPTRGIKRNDLQIQISDMENSVQSWENNHLHDHWYGTIQGKGETVQEIDHLLNVQMEQLQEKVNQQQRKIEQQQAEISSKMQEVNQDISEKEAALSEINAKMQDILPGWAKGLVDVEDVIQLFPPFLIILCIYIIGLGVALTRHFLFIARAMGLKKSDKADPAVSSWWTLVNKGKLGTFLTGATYIGIIIVMWLFFEWGYLLFMRWSQTTDFQTYLTIILKSNFFPWICRLIVLFLLFVIIKKPKLFFEIS